MNEPANRQIRLDRPGLAPRLRALDEIGFDASTEDTALDPIARMAKFALGADLGFVSFPVEDGAWRKGLSDPAERTVEGDSFCHYTVESDDALCINDLKSDPRFKSSALAKAKSAPRAYGAAPIILTDGIRVGTVGVSYKSPHRFTVKDQAILAELAETAAQHFELRREVMALRKIGKANDTVDHMMERFIESAPVSVALIDRDRRVVQVSPRWRLDMGEGDTRLIDRPLEDVFPGSTHVWAQLFRRCLAGEVLRNESVELTDRSGVVRCIRAEVAPWTSLNGEPAGFILLAHNISDMLQSLRAAERSEQRLKLAVEMADMVVFDLHLPSGRLFQLGAAHLIADEDGKIAKSPLDVLRGVHPKDTPRVLREWKKALKSTERQFQTSYRLERPGRDIWLSCTSDIHFDEDGAPERILGVIRDITLEHEASQAMADARDQAEASSRAKTEFLANMSHEIRTPLNGVLGVAGALARTKLDLRQKEMVRLIESSAGALERLLTDILDLARVESGRSELAIEPFELMELLVGVTALFEPRAREKGVQFDFVPDLDALGCYLGDIVRLRQILSNFLSNAVKFTHEGSVELTVRTEPAPDSDKTRLTFSVIDTGIGFDPEAKERLFQRFEQADTSITRKYGGTGLGLPICRALAEQMNGVVDAAPNPGGGSVFTFTVDLPQAERKRIDVAKTDTDSADLTQTPERARILVAEDHPANRKVVELILGQVNAHLTTVENGAEAVAAATSQDFALILMDIQMPVMDGLTAIRAIRQQETARGRPRTPILTLSANALQEHVAESLAAGADGHITKPVRAVVLLDAVAAAFRGEDLSDVSDRMSA